MFQVNEKDRLDVLYSYKVLETEPEVEFDELTRISHRNNYEKIYLFDCECVNPDFQ